MQCGAWFHCLLRALRSSKHNKQQRRAAAEEKQQQCAAVEQQQRWQQQQAALVQQQLQALLAEALDICIQHYFAAEDTLRLWASSRPLQQLVSSRISGSLLLRSVAAVAQQAAAADCDDYDADYSSMKALHSLLRRPETSADVINQCSQQLLAIPGVPLAAAKALVAAGLRVQVTGQQLVERAYLCFEGLGVWVEAFSAAGVPLAEWAAELPAELLMVCGSTTSTPEQLVRDLTPARTANLLAVALTIAACRRPFHYISRFAIAMISCMFRQPAYTATVQLSPAAVEALLRLTMQLQGRTTNRAMAGSWPEIMYRLCKLPAAAQLPTAMVVEMGYQAVQSLGVYAPYTAYIAAQCAAHIFELMAAGELTAEQVETLLSLLRGPTAAAAAAAAAAKAYQSWRVPDGRSVMVWLASQPGAAAAAAGLGLTAADVGDPAAAALLIGGQ
uniref:Uncharacterized protein n=1 Tax=Tetradesmus obliquus TaxID=3088 RepID=A0A383VVR9_TETOB|eukprot:jgi/Sobl393_1/3428/SZX68949.1